MADLAFTTHGNPKNPAVLLLHGFMSCGAQWHLNIPALNRHYFLISVELWGHGDSPTPAEPACYSIDAYLEQFESIRLRFAIRRWHLIGQSYGAGLVLNYALRHADSCTSVIVTNSRSALGNLPGPASGRPKYEKAGFHPRDLPFHPIHARRFPEELKSNLVASADAMTVPAIKHGANLGSAMNFTERLGLLTTPLMITSGVYEKGWVADLEHLRQQYPDLKVEDLPGGHSINIEAAEGFNRVCLEFFTQHRA
ncbi:MAG: alpha/beta hydrolase [Pseudomonadota bacterium]